MGSRYLWAAPPESCKKARLLNNILQLFLLASKSLSNVPLLSKEL